MFESLSKLTTLQTILKNYTAQEVTKALTNIKAIIQSLDVHALDLLSNRRKFGVIIGQGDTKTTHHYQEEPKAAQPLEQILLDDAQLTDVINQLCLTEAIIVRDTFKELVELKITNTQGNQTAQPLESSNGADEKINLVKKEPNKSQTANQATSIDNINNSKVSNSNNVAPIKLVEVKQRLAQAIKGPKDKEAQIKNKLNSLLTPQENINTVKSKQA